MLRFPLHLRRALLLLAAAMLTPLATCADVSADGAAALIGPGPGRLSILLTDAGDLRKAVVTISQIYRQGTGDDPAACVILLNTPMTTDLLTLANTTATLVQDARYRRARTSATAG